MLDPILITKPAALPVTLAEAKAHLRVDHDDDDAVIEGMISASVDHLDGFTGILGRCLVDQKWVQRLPSFARCIELRLGNLLQVTDITYFDSDNVEQSFTLTGVQQHRRSGHDILTIESELPATAKRADAVSITYRAGFGDSDEIPVAIKHAILLMVGHFYEHREAVSMAQNINELPLGVDRLLKPYRFVRIA